MITIYGWSTREMLRHVRGLVMSAWLEDRRQFQPLLSSYVTGMLVAATAALADYASRGLEPSDPAKPLFPSQTRAVLKSALRTAHDRVGSPLPDASVIDDSEALPLLAEVIFLETVIDAFTGGIQLSVVQEVKDSGALAESRANAYPYSTSNSMPILGVEKLAWSMLGPSKEALQQVAELRCRWEFHKELPPSDARRRRRHRLRETRASGIRPRRR